MARWIDEQGEWLPSPKGVDDGEEDKEEGLAPSAVVIYVPVLCPYCHSDDCPVSGSPPTRSPVAGRLRYHRCRACGQAFKSLERPR